MAILEGADRESEVAELLAYLRRCMTPETLSLHRAQEHALEGFAAEPVACRLLSDFGGVLVGGAVRDVIRCGLGASRRPRDLDVHVEVSATKSPAWASFLEAHPPTHRNTAGHPGGVVGVLTWASDGAIPVQAVVLDGHDTAAQIAGYFDSPANAVTWSPARGLVAYGPGWSDAARGLYRPHWPGIFASTGPARFMQRLVTRLQAGAGWCVDAADVQAVTTLAVAHLGGPTAWSGVHPSAGPQAAPRAASRATVDADDVPF